MTKPLTVAVIGLGYFSQFHLNAWAAYKDVGTVVVTDPDANRCEWANDGYGVQSYPDLEALLADHSPDIVDIIAPPPAHADLITKLAILGGTVICQKPFCTSLEEAEQTTALARETSTTLIIHENFRFQPWHRTIKAFVDEGHLGQIYQCRFALRPGDGQGPDAYLSRQPAFRDMPRLLVHETGVHFVDLFRWLFGEIEDVYADLRQLNPVLAGEDAGMLILNHTGGVQSLFDGNRLSDHATDNPRRTMGEMTIEGENGVLSLNGAGEVSFRAKDSMTLQTIPLCAAIDDASFGGGCVAALIDHVVAATRGQGTIENAAADYLPVIRATEAAYRSATEGRKITL